MLGWRFEEFQRDEDLPLNAGACSGLILSRCKSGPARRNCQCRFKALQMSCRSGRSSSRSEWVGGDGLLSTDAYASKRTMSMARAGRAADSRARQSHRPAPQCHTPLILLTHGGDLRRLFVPTRRPFRSSQTTVKDSERLQVSTTKILGSQLSLRRTEAAMKTSLLTMISFLTGLMLPTWPGETLTFYRRRGRRVAARQAALKRMDRTSG